MPINPSAAASAYASAAKLIGSASGSSETAPGPANPAGFAEMVKSAVEGTLSTGGAAEAKAAELANGNADVVELVTAVAETELAIQSMVTVRDRVIAAYQDIMNMPV
jgi:flagellar hook-basal body complex protein FliE